MANDLYSLLSPRLDPSPLPAINSLTGMVSDQNHLAEQKRSSMVQEAEQNRSNVSREGLAQQGVDLQKQQFGWGRTKDQHSALEQYISLMNAGDFEGAQQMAPAMKAMGIELKAADQHQAQQPSPQPPALNPSMAPPEEEGPDPQEMTDAAERIRSIGGDDSSLRMPQPKPQPPPMQPAPQQPQLRGMTSLPPPEQSTGPLPLIHAQFDGQDMGIIDPNKRVAQEKAYVANEVGSRIDSLPGRFKPLARGAYEGVTNREALAGRDKYWSGTKDELFAGERAQAQAEAMGARQGGQQDFQAGSEVRDMIKDEMTKTKADRATVVKLQGLIDQFKSSSSVQQRLALGAQLKAMFGAAASEGERSYLLGAAGKWASIETKVNEWTNEGQLSPDLVNQLEDASKDMQDSLSVALRDRGAYVANAIKADPTLVPILGPERAQQFAESAYYGIAGGQPPKPWKGGPAPGGSGSGHSRSVRTKGVNPFSGDPMQTPAVERQYPDSPTRVTLPQHDPKNFPNAPKGL